MPTRSCLRRRTRARGRVDPRYPSPRRPFLRRRSISRKRPARRPRSASRSWTSRSSGRASTTGPTFPPMARNGTSCSPMAKRFKVGNIDARVMFSPGHTLASITYVIGDAAFVHDTLFMPDSRHGAGRLPRRQRRSSSGARSRRSWRCPTRRASSPATTTSRAGASRNGNPPSPSRRRRTPTCRAPQTEEAFVAVREARDRTLPMPKLILHALAGQHECRAPARARNATADAISKFPSTLLEGAAWD